MSTARKGTRSSPRRKAVAKSAPRRTGTASLPAPLPAVSKAVNGGAPAEPIDAYAEAVRFLQEQLGHASANLFQGYDRLAAFHRENVEAALLSGRVAAGGVESIGKAWLELGQHALESGAAAAKALVGVRTLQELVELQADLVRATLDRLLVDSVRISELSVRAANEAAAPLTARAETALGTLLRRAAA